MPRYHISRLKGEPSVCKATKVCPFGDLVAEHYSSREEAMEAYERHMAELALTTSSRGGVSAAALPKGYRVDEETLVVPKGLYLLGDPSLTLGKLSGAWEAWKKAAQKNNPELLAVGALLNGQVATALKGIHGGGTFTSSSGQALEAPEGLMGLTSVSLLRKLGFSKEDLQEAGVFVSFSEATKISHDYGVLSFGEGIQVFSDTSGAPRGEDLEKLLDSWEEEPSTYEDLGADSEDLEAPTRGLAPRQTKAPKDPYSLYDYDDEDLIDDW